MRKRSHLFVLAAALTTSPCLAQGTSSAVPTSPLAAFIRIAGTLGQPVASLERSWPLTLSTDNPLSQFSLTPARVLSVQVGRGAIGGEAGARVQRVTLHEVLPDTGALRRYVVDMQRELESSFGAASRCIGANGAPDALFAPQSTSRIWSKGAGAHATRLTWEVTPQRAFVVMLTAGVTGEDAPDTYDCATRFP